MAVKGIFIELASAEKQGIVWKSYMYNLKQGTLKFLLNAAIDTLPTAANLKRWKKSISDLCNLCKRRQTTYHIMNACPAALITGRYTWRHNCVINYIVNCVDTKFTVYSDLPGHTAPGGGSIPPELCVKPDKVILYKHEKQFTYSNSHVLRRSILTLGTLKKVTSTSISPQTLQNTNVK